MAIYFMQPLFPGQTVYLYTLGILAIIAGIYLGWIDKNKGKTGFMISRYVVGALFILLGIFFMLPSGQESGDQIVWQTYSAEIVEKAISSRQPVIIDFYADWCIPCKELDKFTFSDKRVIAEAKNFIMLKSDLTHFQSEQTNLLRERYNIKGVPTIVFIAKTGQEITDKRLVGFEEADQFLQRMQETIK
jgi:thiol:disulfide interchange protein DsbD